MSPNPQQDWLNDYDPQLPADLPASLRPVVKQAIIHKHTTSGVTVTDVARVFAPYVDSDRALMLAITELTRADSAATNAIQRYLHQRGVRQVRYWNTNNDPHVCGICAAFAKQPESVWAHEFPLGPPAHDGCRCSIGLRLDTSQTKANPPPADGLFQQLKRLFQRFIQNRK